MVEDMVFKTTGSKAINGFSKPWHELNYGNVIVQGKKYLGIIFV
jgi:hypothetical protein